MLKKLLPPSLFLLCLLLIRVWQLSNRRLSQLAQISQLPPQLTLKSDQHAYSFDLQKIHLRYQPPRFLAFKDEIPFSFDETAFNQQIAALAAQLDQPATEPTVEVIKRKIVINPGQNGQELNQTKLIAQIKIQLAKADPAIVNLPLTSLQPQMTPVEVDLIRQRIESLFNKKITLLNPPDQWWLKDEELINFLQPQKLTDWVKTLAATIDRPPQNATFQFQGQRVTLFRPARDGQTLDENQTLELMHKALSALENGAASQTITLPVTFNPPSITTNSVNNLGIRELLAQGESFFSHSISSRIHNLTLAAGKLNGLLVAPSEVFSFNQTLGDISPETGYQPAYIIKEGRTILGDGGGVCQVSTTLFRAVLNAGLPILERHAHAYRVSYYEQKSPPGFDATVFFPTADFKFQNDTANYLLIQSNVDKKTQKLTFEIYGAKDGREVQISSPKITDQIPPPPDLYQDDPTLPAGQIKQVDWSAWGAKVSFNWQVTRNGEALQNKTFVSNYRPWQAVYLRGTARP
jgi:vancomycin resistance protein YoaR